MSNKPSLIAASSPEVNAIVSASAGTGKTYLLVTRIIRQLLAGAAAERILALTFTRKAAGEMRQRLHERLRNMATMDDARLEETLTGMGVAADATYLEQSRRLYERLMLSPRPLRISTFHAFCQQLLQRFPLEADVPPGYELLQASSVLQGAAWDALFLEATHNPEGVLAQALETLFIACNGLANTHHVLMQAFLARRNDWLAYTQDREKPVDYACECLHQLLQLYDCEPLTAFFSDANNNRLRRFRELLLQHDTGTNSKHAALIEAGLNTENAIKSRFESIKGAFLTKDLEPRQRKNSKALEKALGAGGVAEFLESHDYFCRQLLITHETLLRLDYFRTAGAWYRAGDALMQHYQQIKQKQRLLDFDDLEWKAYRLLHHRDHALWVQYKIDQKIDHLLIDEFQDTNPTQWQLILPLLEEMADTGKSIERRRSVFLVGDGKQSIYSFRRADPQLQDAASAWLRQRLDAREFPLVKSWRSADAIMQTLNYLFQDTALGRNLNAFQPHESHRSELWGWVEILPCVQPPPPKPAEASPASKLRDPLTTARASSDIDIRYLEGCTIARRIHELIDGGCSVEKSDGSRNAVDYDDIFILFRTRTHIAAYEQALTDHAIPFASLEKGTLLEQQEVEDIEALLNVLLTPFNNLALAHVLKSPIFGAADEDLMRLSVLQGDWYGRLKAYSEDTAADRSPALLRAWSLLSAWRKLLPVLPLHDLLDRIFYQGDLIARYHRATPPMLANRVLSNLQRLLALALEIDSGRYPSLSNFLLQLKRIRASEQDQPDTPPFDTGERKVRLMTIHAAKGLEAPVVFVADACTGAARTDSYYALVDWPHTADKPLQLLLFTTKSQMPAVVEPVLERQRQRQLREQANLLYVALSRAKQMLFISGSGSNSGVMESADWYQNIVQALQPHATLLPDGRYRLTNGQPWPSPQSRLARAPVQGPAIEIPLLRIAPLETAIAPGDIAKHETSSGITPEQKLLSRQHGTAIHKMLEMLSAPAPLPTVELNVFLDYGIKREHLTAWKMEALAVLVKPELQFLFNPELYDKAYKEVPLVYRAAEGQTVYGIIDRVVLRNEEIWVIDYKTRTADDPRSLQELLQYYRPQLHYYAGGLRQIWPGKTVRPAILLTGTQTLHMVD